MSLTIHMYAETWNGEQWSPLYPVRGEGLQELLTQWELSREFPEDAFERLCKIDVDMQPLYTGGFTRLFEALTGVLSEQQVEAAYQRAIAGRDPMEDPLAGDFAVRLAQALIEQGDEPTEIPPAFPDTLDELPPGVSTGMTLMWLVGPYSSDYGRYNLATGTQLLAVDTDYVFGEQSSSRDIEVEKWEEARILVRQLGPENVRVFFWYTT